MWKAAYKKVDKSGLRPDLVVTVEFSNDVDDTTYLLDYACMPQEFDSDGFKAGLQGQIDVLDAKDVVTLDAIAAVVDKAIDVKPLLVQPII